MQPNYPQSPSGPGPQPPYQPPQYGASPNPAPQQPQQPYYDATSASQQHPNGQYAVVPPMPAGNNDGHTGHNPYEFIMNPNAPKRPGIFTIAGGNNSFLVRIGLILGGMVLLMIIIALATSALKPKGNTTGLTAIAQRQQEIVRIATDAATKTTSSDTKNFVSNVSASVASDQFQNLSYLQAHGTKLKGKSLAVDQSAQTDSLLTNAASANNYDSAVTQTLTQQLQTYEGLLQTTFKQTNSTTAKALLQSSFTNADKLLKQAKSLPATSD